MGVEGHRSFNLILFQRSPHMFRPHEAVCVSCGKVDAEMKMKQNVYLIVLKDPRRT